MPLMHESAYQDPMISVARRFYASEFLCERATRLAFLSDWVSGFSAFDNLACNKRALPAASWFHDAWCVDGIRAGSFTPQMILAEAPDEMQRERSACIAAELLADVVDERTCADIGAAIRESGLRGTRMPEAMILREAVNLDSIGPLWLCGQLARCEMQNRPVGSIVAVWERQVEYHYWANRIAETLSFERSRELARRRLDALDATMIALRDQVTTSDRHVAPESL